MKNLSPRALHGSICTILTLIGCSVPLGGQTAHPSQAPPATLAAFSAPAPRTAAPSRVWGNFELLRPAAAARAAPGVKAPFEPYPTNLYQAPFSRIGVGADVSPLGIGLKAAIVLNTYMDLRVMGNYFQYNGGRYEVDGLNVYPRIHLSSAITSLDIYPFHSIWRFSAGALFPNHNGISASTRIASGASFGLNHQTFYAPAPGPGVKPLQGSGAIGLNTNRPAFVLSGGFGKFIPRSDRHWSFPSEFGVAFMGPPSVTVSTSGQVCLDKALTQCGNIGDPASPVAVEFNNDLQTRLTRFRKNASDFRFYPIFSYSVVYSFNTPW